MLFAKIPRHTRQNAITEGDLECILTRNCEGTEQLRKIRELPSDPLNNLTIKKTCEGRALTVAKAALPSRTPPGHAKQELNFKFNQ